MWVYSLLLKVFNMSLTAGIIILFVLIARILLRKAPKIFSYILWAVVLFRLICPVSFSFRFSPLNLFNTPVAENGSNVYIPEDVVHSEYPQVNLPLPAVNEAINNNLPQGEEQTVADPLEFPMAAATILWLSGIAAMLIYSAVSLIKLYRKLTGAVCLRDNIYLADHIATPFVIGVISPKIYLPSSIPEQEQGYIIMHEQTHIRRLDHIFKIIAFIALSIHWFNPLVWVAFFCAAKDMEMSCDESVLKKMGSEIKCDYSASLLSLAAGRRIINGSPLAFSEGSIKQRVKNVLNFKKPATWIIAASVLLVAVLSICFAANKANADRKEAQNGSGPVQNENDIKSGSEALTNVEALFGEQDTIILEQAYNTEYNTVNIEYIPTEPGQISEFGTTYQKIVAFIDTTIRNSSEAAQETELDQNYINHYKIKLSNDTGEYSCELYYDTLYNKAYILKDGGLYKTGTDFARYIDSFRRNTDITLQAADSKTATLFAKYGWTLDYKLGRTDGKLNSITSLSGFDPSDCYFAYNNELSKDIGLDMSIYPKGYYVDIDIYRVHESMPEEFYPIQNCRGIVLKHNGEIIGAFISAGRHRTFNACSLKGNSFEKVTGKTVDEWLSDKLKADEYDKRLSKLEPEKVIEEYFKALDNKDFHAAQACVSKKTLLDYLTANMPNNKLFNEAVSLPLTDSPMPGGNDNLKSAKLIKVEPLVDEQLHGAGDENTKTFMVTVDLQYREIVTIGNGEQPWNCRMVFESPQTGWKIESFGH